MIKKLNICFVANNLAVGGVSTVLINLCNQLDKNRFNVHLLLLSTNQTMEKIMTIDSSVKRHFIDFDFTDKYSLIEYLKIAYYRNASRQKVGPFLNKIIELEIDILHFHTLPRYLKLGQLAKKENEKLILIFTDHLVRLEEATINWYQKYLLEAAFKQFYKKYTVIAVSKAVCNSIKKNNRLDKKRSLHLLENSINLKNYNRKKPIIEIEKNQFIYVSRMNHHKGQETLIKAWKKLNNPSKGTLVLAGPDESNGKFNELCKECSSIIITGSISNVKEYIESSNIAVFPSQKEGLPIALLEKMALELPTICSDIPELTSIITNNTDGLHFKLDNVDDLVQKLDFAINNKHKMIEMGKNARKKVEEICNKNNSTKFHDNLYNSLLKK